MNFPADHIERIREFGYTESEARFLYIVAVHSGYFTLGQFRAFTGTAYGKRPTSFAEKVLKRGHATIRDYMRRGSIFHLFSRTIYGQIDKDSLRNRKRHSFEFMRSRLVLLDFVLANQDLKYFETEQDKVRFFCDELGVPKDSLPAKVYEGSPDSKPTLRYFVDKFPLFLSSPFSGAPPVVTLRCRLAPGRCGVPATLYWRQTRAIVRYPEWHATLAQQHRGSLANGTAQGDGIRRAWYGLARFPSFPQNVAAW